MSNFHSQLASIIEVLAKAAIADICKLVDNGFAVLHMEISRSHNENRALKRKLQMSKRRFPRVYTERTGALPLSSMNGGSKRVDDSRASSKKEGYSPTAEAAFDNGKPSAVGEEEYSQSALKEEAEPRIKERPELIIIKEESHEEDFGNSDQHGCPTDWHKRAVESADGDSERRTPFVDTQGLVAKEPDDHPGPHRHRQSAWEDRGAILKTELENGAINQRLQHTGSEPNVGRQSDLDYEYVLGERPNQLETFFVQGSTKTETEEPACSYSAEADSKGLSVRSELLADPSASFNASSSMASPGRIDGKPQVITMHSMTPEVDLCSTFNKKIVSGAVRTQHIFYREDGKRDESQQRSSVNMCPWSAQMVQRRRIEKSVSTAPVAQYVPCAGGFASLESIGAYQKVGAKKKKFICTHCGKSFTCPKNLETHQRVHTGERPFSCTECGKRFAQSGNLKRHQTVHTGERPFCCTICGKRFSFIGNLKRHQSVHIGRTPLGYSSSLGKS